MLNPLCQRLDEMSDDIQIGGDVNFRAMSIVAKKADLTKKQVREIQRLLDLADTLITHLVGFWDKFPELKDVADPAEIAGTDLRASNVE